MLKIAGLLLQKNSIPYDKEELSFQIQSHPSYPSLHSVTGVFDHFNIENVAARVPNNLEVLEQLPKSFMAQFNGEKGIQMVLVEKEKSGVAIFDEEKKKSEISEDDFIKGFTGIIVAVEKSEDDTKAVKVSKSYTTVGFVIAALIFGGVLAISNTSIVPWVTLVLSIVGVVISVSIVKQEFGIQNSIGSAFCTSDSEKKDCNAVLSSKGANIVGNYKLSDLSLIYFVGLSLSTALLFAQNLDISYVYFIAIASTPITIYSIYYQAAVLKTWCLLCLSIVGLLWIQAAVPVLMVPTLFDFNFSLISLLLVVGSFLLTFTLWSYLKPQYKEAEENKKFKIDYYQFKRKYNIFSTLLKSNDALDTEVNDAGQIVFGNKEANVEIVVITNPFCGHCKPVHTVIEDVLKQFKDQVKIIIRFNIQMDKEGDAVKITSGLLDIYENQGEDKCLEAMEEAYLKLSPKEWIEKWYPKNIDSEKRFENLTKQKDWCGEHKINFTPEILVNGRSFPKEYDRGDIAFFIEDLQEEYAPVVET